MSRDHVVEQCKQKLWVFFCVVYFSLLKFCKMKDILLIFFPFRCVISYEDKMLTLKRGIKNKCVTVMLKCREPKAPCKMYINNYNFQCGVYPYSYGMQLPIGISQPTWRCKTFQYIAVLSSFSFSCISCSYVKSFRKVLVNPTEYWNVLKCIYIAYKESHLCLRCVFCDKWFCDDCTT